MKKLGEFLVFIKDTEVYYKELNKKDRDDARYPNFNFVIEKIKIELTSSDLEASKVEKALDEMNAGGDLEELKKKIHTNAYLLSVYLSQVINALKSPVSVSVLDANKKAISEGENKEARYYPFYLGREEIIFLDKNNILVYEEFLSQVNAIWNPAPGLWTQFKQEWRESYYAKSANIISTLINEGLSLASIWGDTLLEENRTKATYYYEAARLKLGRAADCAGDVDQIEKAVNAVITSGVKHKSST